MNLHLSFHTIIILAYTLPNIYVFLRILQIFIRKGHKLYYTFLYILFASVYPASNVFEEHNAGFFAGILMNISDYLLPFYLYLFLLVILFDIFLLINIIFKIVPAEVIRSKRFKITGLSLILSLSVAVVVAGSINFNTIRTSEYRISIPGKSSVMTHLKVAFVADFHLKENTSIHFVKRFSEKIAAIKPDLMLFGGDIVEGDRENENMTAIENILREISTKYGVFGVLGNHEYYSGHDRGSFFYKAGIKILCDTIVLIDNTLNLAGRYDSHFRSRKPIYELMKSANDSLPTILLDHRPTDLFQVSLSAADVQFSGHTHNGQLFPINLITRKVYELSWGYLQKENTHFFVTSGIRLWGPPVRTTGKSEIMVVDITFTGQ